MLTAALILLLVGGLALVAWALVAVTGWWMWPLCGGAVSIALALIVIGRDRLRTIWAQGLRAVIRGEKR